MQVAHVPAPVMRVTNSSASKDMNPGIRMAIAHVCYSNNLTRAEKQSFISSLEGIEEAVGDDPRLLLKMMSVIAMAEAQHESEDRRRITLADTEAPPLGWSREMYASSGEDADTLDVIV